MSRAAFAGLVAVLLAGCQGGPEPMKIPPTPPDGQPMAYAIAIQRARGLATSATEAFYVDRWAEVENAAANLEETANLLTKAPDVPMSLKASVAGQSAALVADVKALRESAKDRNEEKTNEALQRIHFRVRKMRPE